MYHSISVPANRNIHPYFETNTSPQVFESQMRYLSEHGYSTISPDDVVALLSSGTADSRKKVVITFDDGFRDFYTNAAPILKNYGLTATMYLPTAYINQGGKPLLGKECLSWTEVRELHANGMNFGSHTVTHPTLRFMAENELEREIRNSKETIENELGVSITSFAYPYAFPEHDKAFAHRLRDLLKSSGYDNGVSTVVGSVQNLEERFFLRRLPVNSWDDLTFFRAKLNGDYDWLRIPQYLKKFLQRRFKERHAATPPMARQNNSEAGQ